MPRKTKNQIEPRSWRFTLLNIALSLVSFYLAYAIVASGNGATIYGFVGVFFFSFVGIGAFIAAFLGTRSATYRSFSWLFDMILP